MIPTVLADLIPGFQQAVENGSFLENSQEQGFMSQLKVIVDQIEGLEDGTLEPGDLPADLLALLNQLQESGITLPQVANSLRQLLSAQPSDLPVKSTLRLPSESQETELPESTDMLLEDEPGSQETDSQDTDALFKELSAGKQLKKGLENAPDFVAKAHDRPGTQPLPENASIKAVAGGLLHLQGSVSSQGKAEMPQLFIPQPIASDKWNSAIGERLIFMVNKDIQSAEIKLNPPQMGPVELKVTMHQEQASVTLLAQHAATREALEQAIPRLREMMESQNLNLGDVNVGVREESAFADQQTAQSGQEGHEGEQGPTGLDDSDQVPSEVSQSTEASAYVLDAYA